ncbi:hypothetical protein CsSME_00028317 [Camellia sinensis var. sinensis]
MVSANDHVEFSFNPFQVVKDVFLPLESGIRKAAKDFEHCWPGSKNGANNSLEVVATQLNQGSAKKENKVQTCSVKKKSYQCVISDERKKDLSINVPIKSFSGIFSQNCGSNNGHKIDMLNKGLKGDVGNADATCSNCLHFAVMWSLLLNGFFQFFPSPFKSGKKRFHKTGDEDKDCMHSCAQASKPWVSCEIKRKESKGLFVATFQNEDSKHKEGINLSIECFIGFVCDQLTQNLQKFNLGVQESECKSNDSCPTPCATNQVNHLKAVTNILEGKRADVNGFLGNWKFARVGGVPSSSVGVTSAKEGDDDSVIASNKEEAGENSTRKLANGLLSIPLSNVERLRSTLSTVSLTELIKLVPYLGRSSKDYLDKKKLFSVQDFFRYTESEGMFLK